MVNIQEVALAGVGTREKGSGNKNHSRVRLIDWFARR